MKTILKNNGLSLKITIITLMTVILISSNIPLTSANERLPHSVRKAENFLRTLDTAKANFIQTNANGFQLNGTFYLNRPGKLRFDYDNIDDFIVADGIFIYFYDSEMEEQSNAPIGQTLADFMLRKDLRFTGDISVQHVKNSNQFTQITLAQTADPGAGQLILGFTEEPYRLKKWRVIDATGSITEVELFNIETGIKLDKELFVYKDPKRVPGSTFNE